MFTRIFQAIFKTPGKVRINGVDYTGRQFSLTVDGNEVATFTTHPTIEVLDNVESVQSVSGNIHAHKTVTSEIKTVSGDIRVDSASGVKSIRTVSGDIKIKTTR